MNVRNWFNLACWSVIVAIAMTSVAQANTGGDLKRSTQAQQPATEIKADPPFYFTTYSKFGNTLQWITCSVVSGQENCFGYGQLDPMGRSCAMAGSSRMVYVMDSADPSGYLSINVYRQEQSATPSATRLKHILLQIPASGNAKCAMAVEGNFLYIGTDQSLQFFKMDLSSYVATLGAACGGVTNGIHASNDVVVIDQNNCFVAYDKQGNLLESLGGGQAYVPATNGVAIP